MSKCRVRVSSPFIKEAIIKAFNEAGGAEYLRKVAKSDPRTFCALLAKVLPTQVTADPSIPLQIIDRIEYVVIPSPVGGQLIGRALFAAGAVSVAAVLGT